VASALDILVSPAKVDEPIETLFVGQTRVGQRNRAFDKDAHWRHLAITTERSVHSGDVALRCWEKTHAFSAVTLLVWWQEGHPACKKQ